MEGVAQGDTVTVIAETEDGKTVASSVVEPGQRGQAPPTR
jgi:phosphotransferase system HPr-like phosphotransfer protein